MIPIVWFAIACLGSFILGSGLEKRIKSACSVQVEEGQCIQITANDPVVEWNK